MASPMRVAVSPALATDSEKAWPRTGGRARIDDAVRFAEAGIAAIGRS